MALGLCTPAGKSWPGTRERPGGSPHAQRIVSPQRKTWNVSETWNVSFAWESTLQADFGVPVKHAPWAGNDNTVHPTFGSRVDPKPSGRHSEVVGSVITFQENGRNPSDGARGSRCSG